MRGRLRDFSTTHIIGLIFRHKLIIAISNGVLNCISHYKLIPRQPKPLRNFSWYTESDGRQSHRHIYRAVSPLCAMHRNNCSEMWKVELVRAQIDHRSLFLLKTQWQQSRDVLLYHSVLQHSRESIDHRGRRHRSCGMCCAFCTFWGHHLTVNSHPTKTNSAQLLLPLDTCSFSNQRLSCSTVHYQVSRRDFRGSSRPCRILVALATPGSRIPDRLLTDCAKTSIPKRQQEQFHPCCVVSLGIQPHEDLLAFPSPSMGFGDRRIDCLSCREPFARFRTAVRDEKNPRSFRSAFLST